MTILDEIFAHKRQETAQQKALLPFASLRRLAEAAGRPLDFVAGLHLAKTVYGSPALIAEVKKASPSRGLLLADFDPRRLADVYRRNGAAAISVLTDEKYFQGSLDCLCQIAALEPRLPLLRKDFICDPYQIYEARAAGADAVLLIVAELEPSQLSELSALAKELGMAALVEVHCESELQEALDCGARLVGINNRDLRTFTVDLQTTLRLRKNVPPEVCLVAESGIHTSQDVRRLAEAGVDAILVGEALVTAPGYRRQSCRVGRNFRGGGVRMHVKICGITNLEDARAAVALGADMLGFNFYPHSPRYIQPAACAAISAELAQRAPGVTLIGVFVNTPGE